METVRELFRQKGHKPVYSVKPQDSVTYALELMSDNDLGAVLVMENHHIIGIFSERDNARKTELRDRPAHSTPVREVMVDKVIYVTPDYTLEECLAIMENKKIRHLPVIEDNEVIAMIGIQEISGTLIKDQEFMIGELTKYITGALIYEKEKWSHYPELVNQTESIKK